MTTVSVTDVVEAGQCPRRYALVQNGAPTEWARATPVGALVHECVASLVERARTDSALLAALEPPRPSPDETAACVARLLDEVFVGRVVPRLDRFDGEDLQLAGRTLRELARLLSTQIRRARVAGARADQAVDRAIRGSEQSFVCPIDTPAGPALLCGRFDLLIGNEVDDRIEVWELKTFADSTGSFDEQASLYAHALTTVDVGLAGAPLPPALQHVQGGQVSLRAVAPPDGAQLERIGERIAAMVGWKADVASAPAASSASVCLPCPVRSTCWGRFGETVPLSSAPPAAKATGKARPPPARRKPVAQAADAPPAAGGGPSGAVEILIGKDDRGHDVMWSPNDTKQALENFGFLVSGDSGMGKTQLLLALIAGCRRAGLPVVVFDFKNDFGQAEFLATAKLRHHDVREHGLPYNPLTLLPERGRVRPMEQIYKLEAILSRVLGLGVQQGAALNHAIQSACTASGIHLGGFDATEPVPGPSFREVLEHIDGPATLLPRLAPLADLGLLRGDDEVVGNLGELLSSGGVLDVHNVAMGPLQEVLVELTLLAVHARLLQGEQPRRLTRLLVLDEAHRVAASTELAMLMREARAFGLGCALGTQFPGDLRDEAQGSLATKIFLRNDQDAHRTAVARHLGAASGPETSDLKRRLRQLDKHEGYFVNLQHRPYRFVKVVPYYQR